MPTHLSLIIHNSIMHLLEEVSLTGSLYLDEDKRLAVMSSYFYHLRVSNSAGIGGLCDEEVRA